MSEEEEIAAWLQYMENEGVLEWVGMNEDGERTFIFRFDIMSVKMPELYEAMMEELNQELMTLYKMGLVEIEYDENLNAGFRITKEGREYLSDLGIPVPEEFDDES